MPSPRLVTETVLTEKSKGYVQTIVIDSTPVNAVDGRVDLTALKGPKGDPGQDGAPGAPGEPGADSVVPGPPGEPGATTVDGLTDAGALGKAVAKSTTAPAGTVPTSDGNGGVTWATPPSGGSTAGTGNVLTDPATGRPYIEV